MDEKGTIDAIEVSVASTSTNLVTIPRLYLCGNDAGALATQQIIDQYLPAVVSVMAVHMLAKCTVIAIP